MIVRGLWVTRKYDTNAPPELLEAWDEVSIDENLEGFNEACKKALDAVGDDVDEFRYIDMEVPTSAVRQAFQPEVVESTISYREGIAGGSK